ncbi:MAG TPA: MlaD family protein [Coleofasciculaceae cyanobacterium]|jgi:hypothetical protein
MLAPLTQSKFKELPLNRAIISDIVLWVLLAAMLAFGINLFAIRLPERKGQTITLQFQDANEISKGSSVRMMGIDVGYVKDVRIRQDHVEITVQTYPRVLTIPSGSTFTVLFTGLAGAKSIEIELPAASQPPIQGQPVYRVEEPIRMKDLLAANIEITQALQQGAENVTDFFGKRKPVEELQFNIHQAHQWSVSNLVFIDDFNRQVRQLENDVAVSILGGIDTLGTFSQGFRLATDKTAPTGIRSRFTVAANGIRALRSLLISESANTANTAALYGQIASINTANSQLSNWLNRAEDSASRFPLQRNLVQFESGTGSFLAFMSRAESALGQDRLPALRHARQNIQGFNRRLMAWNGNPTSSESKGPPKPSPGPSDIGIARSMPANNAATTAHAQATSASADTRQPDEASAEAITIVDRNGQPVQTLRHRWWAEKSIQKQVQAPVTPAEAIPASPKKPPSPLARFFQTVWDALVSLFQ